MPSEARPGELTKAVLSAIEGYDRPVNAKSIWYRVAKTLPKTSEKTVRVTLANLTTQGVIVRSGTAGDFMYALPPMKQAPVAPTPAAAPTRPAPTPVAPTAAPAAPQALPTPPVAPTTAAETAWEPQPLPEAAPAAAPAQGGADPGSRSLVRLGGFFLNPEQIVVADLSTPDTVRIVTTAMAYDEQHRVPVNMKLAFTRRDDPIEYRKAVNWLERSTGETPDASEEIARMRDECDAALQLADEATRAREAAEQDAKQARQDLSDLRTALGGLGSLLQQGAPRS